MLVWNILHACKDIFFSYDDYKMIHDIIVAKSKLLFDYSYLFLFKITVSLSKMTYCIRLSADTDKTFLQMFY